MQTGIARASATWHAARGGREAGTLGSGPPATGVLCWWHEADDPRPVAATGCVRVGRAGHRACEPHRPRVPRHGRRAGAGAVRCGSADRPGRRLRPHACRGPGGCAAPGRPAATSAAGPGAVRLRPADLGGRRGLRRARPRPCLDLPGAGRRGSPSGHRTVGRHDSAATVRAPVVGGVPHGSRRRPRCAGGRAASRPRGRRGRARRPGQPGRPGSRGGGLGLPTTSADRRQAGSRCLARQARGAASPPPRPGDWSAPRWRPGEAFTRRGPNPAR